MIGRIHDLCTQIVDISVTKFLVSALAKFVQIICRTLKYLLSYNADQGFRGNREKGKKFLDTLAGNLKLRTAVQNWHFKRYCVAVHQSVSGCQSVVSCQVIHFHSPPPHRIFALHTFDQRCVYRQIQC